MLDCETSLAGSVTYPVRSQRPISKCKTPFNPDELSEQWRERVSPNRACMVRDDPAGLGETRFGGVLPGARV